MSDISDSEEQISEVSQYSSEEEEEEEEEEESAGGSDSEQEVRAWTKLKGSGDRRRKKSKRSSGGKRKREKSRRSHSAHSERPQKRVKAESRKIVKPKMPGIPNISEVARRISKDLSLQSNQSLYEECRALFDDLWSAEDSPKVPFSSMGTPCSSDVDNAQRVRIRNRWTLVPTHPLMTKPIEKSELAASFRPSLISHAFYHNTKGFEESVLERTPSHVIVFAKSVGSGKQVRKVGCLRRQEMLLIALVLLQRLMDRAASAQEAAKLDEWRPILAALQFENIHVLQFEKTYLPTKFFPWAFELLITNTRAYSALRSTRSSLAEVDSVWSQVMTPQGSPRSKTSVRDFFDDEKDPNSYKNNAKWQRRVEKIWQVAKQSARVVDMLRAKNVVAAKPKKPAQPPTPHHDDRLDRLIQHVFLALPLKDSPLADIFQRLEEQKRAAEAAKQVKPEAPSTPARPSESSGAAQQTEPKKRKSSTHRREGDHKSHAHKKSGPKPTNKTATRAVQQGRRDASLAEAQKEGANKTPAESANRAGKCDSATRDDPPAKEEQRPTGAATPAAAGPKDKVAAGPKDKAELGEQRIPRMPSPPPHLVAQGSFAQDTLQEEEEEELLVYEMSN